MTAAGSQRAAEPRAVATGRMSTLDALRGLAAFAVTWHHFTGRDTDFLPEGWLKASGTYGWLGVEMFFVISGFVVPWSMWRAGCGIGDYPRFLLKRLVRLHPPFLVSLVFALAGLWVQQRVYGRPWPLTAGDVALHLGYLNALLDRPWANSVYWTLAIWVQYYLVVGLLFPLFVAERTAWRRVGVAAFAALSLLPTPGSVVCEYVLFFVLGTSAFQQRAGRIGMVEHLTVVALATAGLFLLKPPEAVAAGTLTALLVTFVTLENRALLFLGRISYSLYLVHGPIGGQMMLFAERASLGTPARVALLLVTTALTLGLAWVLYRFVEQPAGEWASRIPYRRERPRAA